MKDFICDLELGDHAALFYQTKAEQLASAIPFIAMGLKRNERCLYIADNNPIAEIIRRLEEHGVDVDEAGKTGALRVLTSRETYLRHGVFQPERMVADLCAEVQGALDMGYAGFRATGELTWALDLPSAMGQVVKYEESIENHFYEKFVALCQYDDSRYPTHITDHMKRLHPVIICGGKMTRRRSGT